MLLAQDEPHLGLRVVVLVEPSAPLLNSPSDKCLHGLRSLADACLVNAPDEPRAFRSQRASAMLRSLRVAKPKESKNIPVGIRELEAPQPLVYERQLLDERHTALAELVEERVGVKRVDVRVPTGPFVAGVVWTWKHIGEDRLEHNADPVPAHASV